MGRIESNTLWLKASDIKGLTDGDSLALPWPDASGKGHAASQSNALYRPVYSSTAANGHPAVLFNGADSYFDNSYSYNARTVFILYKIDSSLQQDTDLGQIWGHYGDGAHVAIDARPSFSKRFSFDGGGNAAARYGINGSVFSAFDRNSNTYPWNYDQWELVKVEFQNQESLTRQVIGSLVPNFNLGDHQFGGHIAEMIVFDSLLNATQIMILENYFSSAYNMDLTAIGEDYYTYEALYNHDVSGIGRRSATDMHTLAFSDRLLGVSASTLDSDGSFLLFGHDNAGSLSWSSSEIPSGFTGLQRISREWKVEETGETGELTLIIDTTLLAGRSFSGERYLLLIDKDGDFSSGADVYELASAGMDSLFSRSGLNLETGDYITIAKIAPALGFDDSSFFVFENDTLNLRISLNYIPIDTVIFSLFTSDISALGGSDYSSILPSLMLSISPGQRDTVIEVLPLNDTETELDELFTIQFDSIPSGFAGGGIDSASVTIHDDDNPRKIYFDTPASSISESGDSILIRVRITPSEFDPVNTTYVNYRVTGGTATVADYTLTEGILEIPPYSVAADFTAYILEDAFNEQNETIETQIYNPVNGSLSSVNPVNHTLTILDNDDPPELNFSVSSQTLDETSGIIAISFDLTAVSAQDIYAGFTLSGTAVEGIDYSISAGSLMIPAGSLSGSINMTLINDLQGESLETIILTLDESIPNVVRGEDSIYTLVIEDNDTEVGFTGPAGVGDASINKLWLRADRIEGIMDGEEVETWTDLSGNAHDASQASAGNRPAFRESAINGMPSVEFDGVTDNDYYDNPYAYFGRTVFAIYRVSSTLHSNSDMGQLWGNYEDNVQLALDPRPINPMGWSFDGGGTSRARYALFGEDYTGFFEDDNSVPWTYDQPELVSVEFESAYPITRQVIGSLYPRFSVGQYQYGGDIAELIVYNSKLNNTRRILVENYLAAKYGLDISASGKDYFDFELTYPYDLAGIGRISSSDLHTKAQSAGILILSDATGLGDNEFLITGHDNASVSEWTSAESPSDSLLRIAREWIFDETGETGQIILSFDTSGLPSLPQGYSNLMLIKDSDGNFSEGAEITALSITGGVFKSDPLNIDDGDYISLAVVRPVAGFAMADYNVSETMASGAVQVVLSEALSEDITLYYHIEGGTATPGVDFTLSTDSVIMPAGSVTAEIQFTLNNDTDPELEETFIIELDSVNLYAGLNTDTLTTVIINDNDNDGFTGPGGVGDQVINSLWLVADSISGIPGDPVAFWPDNSGNANNAINLSPGQEPELLTNFIGTHGAIDFEKSNEEYLGNNLSLGISGSGPASVFMVARNTFGANDDNSGLFLGSSSGAGGSVRHYGLEYLATIRFNNGNRIFQDGFTQNEWKMGSWLNKAGDNYGSYTFYLDGSLLAQQSTSGPSNIPATGVELFYVGAGLDGSGTFRDARFFDGQMAEVIAYDYEINAAQRNIIENYLAAKYHQEIATTTDLYAFETTHPHEVAGIGRSSATEFHNTAMSGGIVRISNASGLDDGEYLLFGHDNAGISTWTTNELPVENALRITREWRLDKTGDPGSVKITIDTSLFGVKPVSYPYYILCYDEDGDFSEGAEIAVLQLGDEGYESDLINIPDGSYLTIGVLKPQIYFSTPFSETEESLTNTLVSVSLNFPLPEDISFNYDFRLPATTATPAGVDFELSTNSALISAGDTLVNIPVSITDDSNAETDEFIELVIRASSPLYTIGEDSTHMLTIHDDDNLRSVYFTVGSRAGDEDYSPEYLTIRLDAVDPVNPVYVDYRVIGGTAINTVDFDLPAGTAMITANQISTTVILGFNDDDLYENDENFIVELYNPVNANLGPVSELLFTIRDDESVPEINFSIPSSSGSEENSPALIPLELNRPSAYNITLNYAVTGGTATGGGVDYQNPAGTLIINAGSTEAFISIDLINDLVDETEEDIALALTGTGGGAITGSQSNHTFIIRNSNVAGYSGPGGVGDSDNNTLWLSADTSVALSGNDINIWADLSGNGNDAFNLSPGQEPTWVDDALNGKAVARFDDNGGTNGDYLGANISLGITGSSAATVFMVAKNATAASEDNTGLFIGEANGTGGLVRHYGIELNSTIRFNNGNRIFDDGYAFNQWRIGVIRNSSGDLYGEYSGYLNGNLLGQSSSSSPTSLPNTAGESFFIGAGQGTNGDFMSNRYFEGDMAEVIVYNSELNESQRIIVENYLSSAYDITIASDYYGYDIFHGEDVAGLGRISSTDLHVAAQSAGILLLSGASDLDDGEFALFGHDDAQIASWTNTEIPVPGMLRLQREWRVDMTGSLGEFDLSFDPVRLPVIGSQYANVLLLVDSDGDFSSGARVISLEKEGSVYTAYGVDIQDGDYLTMALAELTAGFEFTELNGSESIGTDSITVILNLPSIEDVEVDYVVKGGTATAGNDFNSAGGTLVIPAGVVSARFPLAIQDDAIVETDETIILALRDLSTGNLTSDSILVYTINDNDNPRVIDFTSVGTGIAEDAGILTIDVALNSPHPTRDLKVAYAAVSGQALEGSDFTLSSDTLTIPAGNLTGTITVSIIDDATDEFDESFAIRLIGTGSLDLNLGTNVLYRDTILDNDAGPEVSFVSVSASGAESFQTKQLNFVLSSASGKDITVEYSVTGGTATSGADFVLPAGTISFPVGTTTRTILYSIIDDAVEENAENIQISLQNPVNAVLGTNAIHTYTILDDDGLGWHGPAGVMNFTQNIVWLNSTHTTGLGDGDPVSLWEDVSGNGHDAKQSGAARPLYLDNPADNWYGKPVIRFDAGYSQYLGIDNSTALNTGGPYDKRTIIVTFRTGIDINSRQVLYEEGGGVRGLNIYVEGGLLYISGWNETNDDGGATTPWYFTSVTTPLQANTPYYAVLQFNFEGSNGDVTGWLNGDLIDVLPGAGRLFNHPGNIGVGGMNNGSVYHTGPQNGTTNFFTGNISELIINNRVYNSAQVKIVNNYLGAKYNIPITDDYYDHQGQYSWGLIGIGKEDDQNLHAIAQGDGIIRMDNPSSLDNGDYLLVAHDNDDLSAWDNTNVPGGDVNIIRADRTWRSDDLTGGIGTVRIAIDADDLPPMPFSFSKYAILVSTSADFSNPANVLVYGLKLNSGTGLYEADGIDLSNNKYFSIAVLNPAVEFLTSSGDGFESESPAEAIIRLNYINASPVNVGINITGGTAIQGNDFTVPQTSLTIPQGIGEGTANLNIINDSQSESNETLILGFASIPANHITGVRDSFVYTIYDDDNSRNIGFTSASISGTESTALVEVEVALNLRDPFNDSRVVYELGTGSASGSGVDFDLVADTLVIPAGDSTGLIALSITNDLFDEEDETIILNLMYSENANLGAVTEYIYTILDDDATPVVQFSTTTGEGPESFSPVMLRFGLSEASGQDVTVYYSQSGGSAINGGIDYNLPSPSQMVIPAGGILDSSFFYIFNDIIEESDEDIQITIDSATNAILGAELSFNYTVYDDDGLGWLGPGGVSDDGGYNIWLKSDEISGLSDGARLTTWEDASLNNIDAAASGGDRPFYRNNAGANVNGRSVVDFAGGNYFLEIPNGINFNTGGPYTQKTLLVAFETGADVTSRQVIYEQGGDVRGLNIYIESGNLHFGGWNLADDDAGATTPWGFERISTPVGTNEVHFAMLEFNADEGTLTAWLDGAEAGSVSGIGYLFTHSGKVGIGAMNNSSHFTSGATSGNGYYFTGKVLEFLNFNKTLNEVQLTIIDNYLGTKFGYTPSNDLYNFKTGYSYELFGIGRETGGSTHIISQGSGIVKVDNPSDMDNGDYFFIGHDNADLSAWTTTEIALDSVKRIAREWKVGENAETGSIRIALDTSALPVLPPLYDNYVMIIDRDGDSDFTTGTLEMIEMVERYGIFARIPSIDLDEGDCFTFGIATNITVTSGNWNNPSTWLMGVPEEGESATVLNTHIVTLTANASIGRLDIAAGGELNLGSHTLSVTGEGINNSGTFTPGTGKVNYSANASQCIASLNYYNLTISGSGTKTLCGDVTVDNDLEILGTQATLFLDADASYNYSIAISGDWKSSGTFVPREGRVVFNGVGIQEIDRNDGGVHTFSSLLIETGSTLLADHNLFVEDSLFMRGDIRNQGFLLTLGTSAAQKGSLSYVDGTITGNLKRWISTTDDGIDIFFPVGSTANHRPVILNFTNVTTNGTLQAGFNSATPGENGLPLDDSGTSLSELFTEGTWSTVSGNGFGFSGSYEVELVADGFVSFPLDSSSRIIARTGSFSNWQVRGNHGRIEDTLVSRTGLTTALYQFGIASGNACEILFENCPNDIVTTTDIGDCGTVINWVAPNLQTLCSGITTVSNYDPGDYFSAGITEVIYIASDVYGNADTCTFTITVEDQEAPAISNCPASRAIPAGLGCQITVPDLRPELVVTDNCDPNPVIRQFPAPGSTTGPGLLTISFDVEDSEGNLSTCNTQITVTQPAVSFSAIDDICINAGTDTLVQGSPSGGTYSGPGISTSPYFDPAIAGAGTHTLLYTYTDINGCAVTATQTITVTDTTGVNFPALAGVCENDGDLTLDQATPTGGIYSGPGVTGGLFSPSVAGPGDHTLTYSYSDGNGCSSVVTQTIRVNAAPEPVINGPIESCLEGNSDFITPSVADHSYAWSVTGATVTGGAGTNQISLYFDTAGTANIEVTESNNITGCAATSAVWSVEVFERPTIGEIQSSNALTR